MRRISNKFVKNVSVYLLSAALSVLLIWYILYHLFSGSENDVKTTPAVISTKSETISLEGYIVRDETVLYAGIEGGVNYLFDDGEKVATGSIVANIYSGVGAEEVSDKILAIDKKIDILENSSVGDDATRMDSNAIDSKINDLFFMIRDKVENNDLEYALYRKDEFLAYLNKRQIITQNSSGYEDQIISLTRERETLSGQLLNLEEKITVSSPGYFYSELDGYEEVFGVSSLKDFTVSSFSQLVESEPVDYSSTLSVGKLVNSDEWYILSEITTDSVKLFGEGETYTVKFPYNSDVTIKMTLDKIIRENECDKAVLVFKTNIMPDGFKYLRKQSIEIVRESYTGYKIPANAVRVVDNKKGVYILSGNTVYFREIVVLTEQDGYFIVKEQPTYLDDEYYYKKLGLYDMVITSGKNLYDGKIIGNTGVDS